MNFQKLKIIIFILTGLIFDISKIFSSQNLTSFNFSKLDEETSRHTSATVGQLFYREQSYISKK